METSSLFAPIVRKKPTSSVVIFEQRWYYQLVSKAARSWALLDRFPQESIRGHLVVCFTPNIVEGKKFRKKDGGIYHMYSYFDSHIDFFHYMTRFPLEDRGFFEIIFGEFPQKPHFDIDIAHEDFREKYPQDDPEKSADRLLESLIQAIEEIFNLHDLVLDISRDVLVYTSHGPNKRSYHLIITNWTHNNNTHAKYFYELVMAQVSKITGGKYLSFVDPKVYSSRQQFRIVGCQKLSSGRVKTFQPNFQYRNISYQHIYRETDPKLLGLVSLYESLVSFSSGCRCLPIQAPLVLSSSTPFSNSPDLPTSLVHRCIELMKRVISPCPFVFLEVSGPMIFLKRLSPSLCPICERVHSAENPYLIVLKEVVYWDCRRRNTTSSRLYIGNVTSDILGVTSSKEEVTPSEGIFCFGEEDPLLERGFKEPVLLQNISETMRSVTRHLERKKSPTPTGFLQPFLMTGSWSPGVPQCPR